MGTEKAFLKEFLVDRLMQAPTGIAIFSAPDSTITAANASYSRMADRPEDDLLGQPLLTALPELRKVMESQLRHVLATGNPYLGG